MEIIAKKKKVLVYACLFASATFTTGYIFYRTMQGRQARYFHSVHKVYTSAFDALTAVFIFSICDTTDSLQYWDLALFYFC